MIQEIRFSGLTASPTDYLCQDGDLAAAINIVPEDGSLTPVLPPTPVLSCSLGGSVKAIHHTQSQDNYIILRDHFLYWIKKSDSLADESQATIITSCPDILSIAAIANTITVATIDGIKHILWKDGAYIALPAAPPFIPISFGMTQVGTLTDHEDLNITFERAARSSSRPAITEENANAVFSHLLSSTKSITSKGYFYLPFFVRYAFRLFDGSYAWHSAPILMLPSAIPPIMKVGEYTTTAEGLHPVPTTLDIPYFSLDYRITSDELSALSKFKDIIAGIDVFISAPIYTFDQSKKALAITSSRSFLLNSYYDWNPLGLDLRSASIPTPSKILTGHYAASREEPFTDHFMPTAADSSFSLWSLPLNERFHDQIKSACLFYKVASIEFEALSPMESYKRLPIKAADLDSLHTLPTLPDDYQSHCAIRPSHLFAFNSRLHMADILLSPASPFSLDSCLQASSSPGPSQLVTVTVYTRMGGVISMAGKSSRWNLESDFPRYIFYPDASAYKMSFSYGDKEIIINLTPHDFLNGAYFYGSLAPDPKPRENAEPETAASILSRIPLPNKVYTSHLSNPFSFPLAGIVTVGSGRILGLSSAAKALSQGQFGQFPLYCFTSEGVWALSVNAEGLYSARQPITRDVVSCPQAITQIDSAVLFPTARGIMLLSGSQTQCISDSLDSSSAHYRAADIQEQFSPEFPRHIAAIWPQAAPVVRAMPFSEYIANCRMAYDYPHQRIIIFNPSQPYAYIFSLSSRLWGMMLSELKESVPSYPDALAITADSMLVNLSREIPARVRVLVISRPLKLDEPNILKTVTEVLTRGMFRGTCISSILYGSRDLLCWQLIRSASSHRLSAFSGSPYKYFRLVLHAYLSPGHTFSGASFQFTPRFRNHLR